MTRRAVLGDIHGNADALEAVLRSARDAGASELVVLGDLVGYYYSPDRVLDLLDGWRSHIISGNHERLLVEWLEGDERRRRELDASYGSGFAACAEYLDEACLERLRSLPTEIRLATVNGEVLLCHGHPNDPDRYVYPDKLATAFSPSDAGDASLVWLAHTHYPMDGTVGGVRVCNPGSVGQPRDHDWRAAWAVWDTESGEITWRRTVYDRTAVLAEVARRDPQVPYLAHVLTRHR